MKEIGRYDTDMQMFVDRKKPVDLTKLSFLRWLVMNHNLEQPAAGPAGGDFAKAAGLDDSENVRRMGIVAMQTSIKNNQRLLRDIGEVFRKTGEDLTSATLSSNQKEPVKADPVRRDPYDTSLQMYVLAEKDLDSTRLGFFRWLAEHGRLEHPVVGPPSGDAVVGSAP